LTSKELIVLPNKIKGAGDLYRANRGLTEKIE